MPRSGFGLNEVLDAGLVVYDFMNTNHSVDLRATIAVVLDIDVYDESRVQRAVPLVI